MFLISCIYWLQRIRVYLLIVHDQYQPVKEAAFIPKVSANHTKLILCMLLMACLLAPFLSTGGYCIASINHHCIGDDCPVCERIQLFLAILTSLKIVQQTHTPFVVLSFIRCAFLGRLPFNIVTTSPIRLFVRMNN